MPTLSRNLTWPELFSEAPPLDYGRIFACWQPRVAIRGEIAPLGMSAFGSIFFAQRDRTIHCLDPLQGELRTIAEDYTQFQNQMNSERWQIENLHSNWVAEVVAMDVHRSPVQSYALAPHPNFTGGLSLEKSKVLVLDPVVWHSVAAQSF